MILPLNIDIIIREYNPKKDRQYLNFVRSESSIWDDTFELARKGKVKMFVSIIEDKPIGRFWLKLETKNKIPEIYAVDVLPQLRGLGIGSFMIDSACKILKYLGYQEAEIGAYKTEVRTQKLYQKLGFEIIGEGLDQWSEILKDGTIFVHKDQTTILRKSLT